MTNRYRVLIGSVSVGPCLSLLLAAATGCGGTSDMTATPDMAGPTLTLKNLPTGCPTTETAADLYTTVVQNTCAIAGCHGVSGTSFQILSATDLHAKLVGQHSNLYPGVSMPLVTAGSLNQSFIMYKLTGSQGQYGSIMPQTTGLPLPNDQLCKFAAWITSGAN